MNMRRLQAGFGLVEVMVALVVLAVGMLGIASLYGTTLRSSNSAISRMQAVNLASDLADRIRANRLARADYTGAPTQEDCAGTNDCSQTEMALNDLYLWDGQVTALLPGNPEWDVGYEAGDAITPDEYTITLEWTEPGIDERLSYVLTMQIAQ